MADDRMMLMELVSQYRIWLNNRVGTQTDWRIQVGPFAGLKLFPELSSWGLIGTALIGTFEPEVHRIIEGWGDTPYDSIINIGAAEGYYLAGLGLRHPTADLVGFETNTDLWADAWTLADLNGVSDRLDLRGTCTPDDMIKLCGEYARPLVIMDIEGGEVDFMMHPEIATLVHADLIIECHDGKREGASKVVSDRLTETHKIRLKGEGPRDANALAFLRKMPQIDRCLLTWEGRGTYCYWLEAASKSAIRLQGD